MANPIQLYKDLIDGVVRIRPSSLCDWVRERGWPDLPENEKINRFLGGLNREQRQILAEIVQQARDGGIHDVLVYLNDEVALRNLRLVRDGVELAAEPFETEMYWDWWARSQGDEWPDARVE